MLYQLQPKSPTLTCLSLVVAVSKQVKRDVEAVLNLFLKVIVAAPNEKLGGSRDLRSPLQKLGQLLGQMLVLRQRESLRFVRKQKIDIGTEFVGCPEDFFFGVNVCTGPGVTLRSFKRACRRVDRGEKLT